ncbi:DUF3995 domain-containing protein [Microbacteriaceae bacterium 4G12]
MTSFVVILSAGILFLIGLIHVYWGLGGRLGKGNALPMKEDGTGLVFIPRKIGTCIVAFVILFFSLTLLAQGGYLPFYQANTFTKWACLLFALIFLVRAIGDFKYIGMFKKVKGSKFAKYDTWLYSPLCLYLTLSFVVAVSM